MDQEKETGKKENRKGKQFALLVCYLYIIILTCAETYNAHVSNFVPISYFIQIPALEN